MASESIASSNGFFGCSVTSICGNEESGDNTTWKYPPFDGHWDGKYIWGRGSTDCKNTLIASLEAVEELVRAKFEPKRTVLLAYGFDEEISGHHGAQHIVDHLFEIYGEKSPT